MRYLSLLFALCFLSSCHTDLYGRWRFVETTDPQGKTIDASFEPQYLEFHWFGRSLWIHGLQQPDESFWIPYHVRDGEITFIDEYDKTGDISLSYFLNEDELRLLSGPAGERYVIRYRRSNQPIKLTDQPTAVSESIVPQ